jgi:hypothetical protein
VRYDSVRRQWRADYKVDCWNTHLGWFDDEVAAARAYDEHARGHRGVRAKLNFPDVKSGLSGSPTGGDGGASSPSSATGKRRSSEGEDEAVRGPVSARMTRMTDGLVN